MANNNGLNWRDLSECAFGLIVTKRVDAHKFTADMFCAPFDDGFDAYFNRKETKTKLSALLGPDYEAALMAAEGVSSQSADEVEWHKNLNRAAKQYTLGVKVERLAKKLKDGSVISIDDATETASSFKDLASPDSIGLTPSNQVEIEDILIEKSGYLPIDENLGGMITSGNILVMGTTGVGKSLFSQQFWGHWLAQYPERKIAIYSLEMTNSQYLNRGLKLFPLFKKAHDEGRILVSDKSTDIATIGIEAASAGVDAIVVDYIDYLIKGEPSEGKFAEIYITMNNISRNLQIPFMMLLQPNRSSYESGVPKMWHARYSGMAENVSAQFWVLYEPKGEDDTNGDFIYIEDSMYIVAWKSRFGWLTSEMSKQLGGNGRGRRGPGAIILPRTKNVWADDEVGDWAIAGDVPKSHKKGRKSE